MGPFRTLNASDYRKRTYIFDGNGVEWEFVQYLTDELEKANTYDA